MVGFVFLAVLEGEVTLWDVPDVLTELYTKRAEVSSLLRELSISRMIDSLDYVLCGAVCDRLHASYNLKSFTVFIQNLEKTDLAC